MRHRLSFSVEALETKNLLSHVTAGIFGPHPPIGGDPRPVRLLPERPVPITIGTPTPPVRRHAPISVPTPISVPVPFFAGEHHDEPDKLYAWSSRANDLHNDQQHRSFCFRSDRAAHRRFFDHTQRPDSLEVKLRCGARVHRLSSS